jgi:2',3'-cyclic-nucleotide 2'-phosphodiesterase (5'-nucleotidase family)
MKFFKVVFCLFSVLFVGCSSPGAKRGSSQEFPLTLLYQGGRSGVTEPCGCHTTPYGGMDREFNAVKATRKESDRVLYVDAGNGLGPEKLKAPLEVYRKKALALVEMLNRASLQVFSPGPQDVALGVAFLKEAQAKAKFAFVNSSLKTPDGKWLFEPFSIQDVKGFKVAVLGISPAGKGSDWVAEEPLKALSSALALVENKADWVLVLSQVPNRELEILAEKTPSAQIFIGTDPQVSLEDPYFVNRGKSLVLDPHIFGYKLGRLIANVQQPFAGFFSPEDIQASKIELEALEKQLTDKKNAVYAKALIERIRSRKLLEPPVGGTQIAHTLIGLSEGTYGARNEVTGLLEKYKAELKKEALSK